MNLALFLCNLVYLAVVIFKLETIIKHEVWIYIHGENYRRALDGLNKKRQGRATPEDLYRVLQETRFAEPWVPWLGIKEFRLKAALARFRREPGLRHLIARYLLRIVVVLHDFAAIGLLGGLLLVWTGIAVKPHEALGSSVRIAALLCVIALILTSFVLAVEPTIVYFSLGSYAVAFQSPLKFVNRRRDVTVVSELVILVSLAAALLYLDSAILSFLVNSGYESFAFPQLIGTRGLFHCVYAVFMTFIFASPLNPSTNLGQFVQIAFSVQGIAVVTVALTGLPATKGTPGKRRRASR